LRLGPSDENAKATQISRRFLRPGKFDRNTALFCVTPYECEVDESPSARDNTQRRENVRKNLN